MVTSTQADTLKQLGVTVMGPFVVPLPAFKNKYMRV